MFHSKIIPNHIDEVFFKWWNFLSELLRGTKVVEGILNLFFITIKNKFVSAILIIPKLKKSLLILTLENIFCLDRYTSTRKYFIFILFFTLHLPSEIVPVLESLDRWRDPYTWRGPAM